MELELAGHVAGMGKSRKLR